MDMLSMGIRAFDLRYAFDPTNTSLIFYHSQALLSETATLDDVLFGFYHWLDEHPSETLILSRQYEGSTALHASNNAAVQLHLYETLTSPAAQAHFVQKKDELGILGEARGKITLMRRFDLDQLPTSYTNNLPGLHFSPSLWTDNSEISRFGPSQSSSASRGTTIRTATSLRASFKSRRWIDHGAERSHRVKFEKSIRSCE